MKYLKILALAAMACTALMAFAASASATELYSGSTTLTSGTVLKSSLKSGTKATLSDTSGFLRNECTGSEVEGSTTATEAEWLPGQLTKLTFSGCTFASTAIEPLGTLEVRHIAGTDNGEVRAGTATQVTTGFGSGNKCIYEAGPGTALGTITGVTSTKETATMDINAVVTLAKTEEGICSSDARWVATYTVTSPAGLNIR